MNQMVFSAAMQPQSFLSRFEVCNTRDLGKAQEWGERIFCENNLRSRDAKEKVDTRIYYRNLGRIGLGRMTYGGDVIIESNLGCCVVVHMPIYGQEMVSC